jgi:hypothetical protein
MNMGSSMLMMTWPSDDDVEEEEDGGFLASPPESLRLCDGVHGLATKLSARSKIANNVKQ